MFCVQPARLPIPVSHTPPRTSPFVEVALRALRELALSVSLGAVCCLFTAMPLILWGGIALQWMTNTALRIALVAMGYPPDNWVTAAITALGSLLNPQILLHELGHALAASRLLEKCHPTIKLFPYIGGSTLFKVSRPTPLGKTLGETNIRPLIAGAGPLLSLSFSVVQWLFAAQLFSHAPELRRMLTMASLINFAFHALYAMSAIAAPAQYLENDFVVLKLAGFSPIIATIALLAIPLMLLNAQAFCETPPRLESRS